MRSREVMQPIQVHIKQFGGTGIWNYFCLIQRHLLFTLFCPQRVIWLMKVTFAIVILLISPVRLLCNLTDAAHQAPLSMGFLRKEYWNGLPFPSLGDLPDSGIEPVSSALAGGFFTTEPHYRFGVLLGWTPVTVARYYRRCPVTCEFQKNNNSSF